jgi:hypothetical protein
VTRIVATGPVAPVAEEILGEIVVADEATLPSLLPRAEALIARGGGRCLTAEQIEAARACAGSGAAGSASRRWTWRRRPAAASPW